MTSEQSRVRFPSREPGIELEGRLHLPEQRGRLPAVVVCHPHPPGGGSMQVKVIWAVARALAAAGHVALRFNFRGVGGSSGRFDDGTGEVEDVAGALDWLADRPEVDGARLGLAGYSFGAMVARRSARVDPRVRALVLIAPPLTWEPTLTLPERPCLLLAGEQDAYCPLADLRRIARDPTTATHLELEEIGATDHFFNGYEERVGSGVARFMTAHCTAG